jgi:hypothetical protein
MVNAQFTFTTNHGAITITGYVGNPTTLNIPDTTNGYPVTSIGHSAFANSFTPSLIQVTIPNGVTNIEANAFGHAPLQNLTIPDSVIAIGNGAFAYCASLTNATLGKGVVSVPSDAFFFCSRLAAINVDSDNAALSSVDGVLFDKAQVTLLQCPEGKTGDYTVPHGVSVITNYAFNRSLLANIFLPETLGSIGDDAFILCQNLTNIVIPDSVTHLGNGAFESCGKLVSAKVGNEVTAIRSQAFYDCKSLLTLTISDHTTDIGDSAFAMCPRLASFTIPDSTTKLGFAVFWGCSSLTNVTIPDGP